MGARKYASVVEVAAEYAAELFSKNGINGTSLADIAKICGISKGTLYYYYPNKDTLVLDCAGTCIKRVGDRVFSWADSFSRDASVEDVCCGLASVFYSAPDETRLLIELLNYTNVEARYLARSALEEWRVLIEVGALRLQRPASERLARLSGSVVPMILGLSVTGADEEIVKNALINMLN